MNIDDLIDRDIADNFKVAEKIKNIAEEKAKSSSDGIYGVRVQNYLLAYICAKQTKHHIVEETLLRKK
jgi:hypothetical protein